MGKQGGVTRRRALRAGGPGGLAGLGVSREPGCVLRGALVLSVPGCASGWAAPCEVQNTLKKKML